jgi:hypothetical protein
MQEELATIDVSPLESLGRIKQELDTLETRLNAMEARRESVAAAVYMRVRADYETQRRALEAEAAPLKATARDQYARLRELLLRSEADHETTRLDREEIEFRFSLGEFDEPEHKKRLKAVDKQLADKAAAREQAEAMKQRFVAVFRSEDELAQAPSAPAPVTPAPTRKLETLSEAQLSAYDTIPPVSSPPAPPPPNATVPPPSVSAGATQMMRAIRPSDLAAAATAAPAPAAAPAARSDSTMIMRTARLVPQNPEAGKQNYTLALKPTVIGSESGCDVRVAAAKRRHADIRVSMAGFTLSDEGGGVRVNGVAVNQHLLRQDDVIEIGPARFTFREG